MNEIERKVLSSLRFNSAPTPDDVWKPSPYNVPELHQQTVERVFDGVLAARHGDDSSPLGVVIQGQSGAGKTHMLGMVRKHIQSEGGYFFLVSLLNGKAFWESTALCMVEGLLRDAGHWDSQLKAFLRRLTSMVGVSADVRDAIAGDAVLTPAHLDTFIAALRGFNRVVGQEAQFTARALVLHGSQDFAAQDVGYAYLNSLEIEDPADRATWRMTGGVRSPQLLVRDMSRLFALTGVPTVIAVDQIDTLFSQYTVALHESPEKREAPEAKLIGQIADGLMSLREVTRRTLTIVACLPDTWKLIRSEAATPVPDRFRETSVLHRIPDERVGRAIVELRLQAHYDAMHFTPPYATWPIKESAFGDADQFTPRGLLKRVERHIALCLRDGRVTELGSLVDVPSGPTTVTEVTVVPREPEAAAMAALDRRFAELVRAADVDRALDGKTEDTAMPALLAAGLQAWTEELGGDGKAYKYDPLPSAKPALHARLRLTLDERTEDELHWAFRAIAGSHARTVISRIQAAQTMAGLDLGTPKRKLVLLRNTTWRLGPKTNAVVDAFVAAGGQLQLIAVEDLKTFDALKTMLAERDPDLTAWLVDRKPAASTELFRDFLDPPAVPAADDRTPTADASEPEQPESAQPAVDEGERPSAPEPNVEPPADPHTIRLGITAEGSALDVGLESLRKHTAIFAGSGSGKTVLIRRLIEECALHGVSAIVLDPNNDLARLGDPWPEPPAVWAPGDAEQATEYLANTDVVVWTPRREGGRPLTFQPLPDFSLVQHDPDEFNAALDAAVAALAPRAKVHTATSKSELGRAVLREALRFYARQPETGLRAFIGILAALPHGVSAIGKADKLAPEMADTLMAAMVNDPLFGGEGTPVDPGQLLTPPPGKRARVSVISFVGLPSDSQRQGFVNQLQMALFAWIKQNPAGDRPLGGLFIMDEAQTLAPSGGMTACTASTLALVSQARKYGLGLVFATQAPRGLHNQIPGNSATQFFGLLNSPTQIEAAKEMAQAKGGTIPEIGLLRTGQFYAAREGAAFAKVQTPLCLTYHPRSPLSPEEVIQRARAGSQ